MTIPIAHELLPDTAPEEPAAKPRPVDPAEYQAATCPLCYGPLQQRIRGLYCIRDKGWLVEELRSGVLVHTLWQGRP